MRIIPVMLAWASVLGLALQASATQRHGLEHLMFVKGKDLSRLPGQSGASSAPSAPSIWEDADVPTEGRGFDPAYTNSSDGQQGAASASSPRSSGPGNSDPRNSDPRNSDPRNSSPANSSGAGAAHPGGGAPNK